MTATAVSLGPVTARSLDDFLAPVPGDDPAGASLRYDGIYQNVRHARRADDPALSQGIWTHEMKRADWDRAAALCQDALVGRSKDLQLAAWLLEAWLHLHGFTGAAAGFEVMHTVAERFWDGLHPRGAEGEACEARGLVVEWVDGTVADALALVPLTLPSVAEAEGRAWVAREGALRLDNLARRDAAAARAAEAKGAVTLARFDRAVALTPVAFYAATAVSLRRAEAAAGRLQALLDERCGADAPGLLRTRGLLAAVRGWAEQVVAARPPEETASPTQETQMSAEPPAAAPQPQAAAPAAADPSVVPIVVAGRGPASREEAYRWLAAAADFLMRNDPHSPVPYMVRRAVSWGQLPLHELMMEFQRNGYDMPALFNLLGMDESPPG